MALTSLDQIKAFLNVSQADESQDLWYDSLRVAAEATVKSYCKRDFESQDYVEYYDGNGTRFLTLRQTPVTAVTSVHLDSTAYYGTNPVTAFAASTLLTPGVDYALAVDAGGTVSKAGIVVRINYTWPELPRNYWFNQLVNDQGPAYGSIKVSYTAGYSEIPADVQYATCFIVSFMKRTINFGGTFFSEHIGDYSYKSLLRDLKNPEIGTARQLLSRYRERSI